jgi:hypothetical protein
VLGAFLVFASQFGAGIPVGVVMARDSGLSPLQTAGLYLASDILLALVFEPLLRLLRWESRQIEWMARLGKQLVHVSGARGLRGGRVRSSVSLSVFSFVFGPAPARAAAEVSGHGPLWGWSFGILGDMVYFGLVMASTLLVIHFFGDDRLVIAPLVVAAWVVPLLVQRLRGQQLGVRVGFRK